MIKNNQLKAWSVTLCSQRIIPLQMPAGDDDFWKWRYLVKTLLELSRIIDGLETIDLQLLIIKSCSKQKQYPFIRLEECILLQTV